MTDFFNYKDEDSDSIELVDNLHIEIKSIKELHECYLGFTSTGGIFIKYNPTHSLQTLDLNKEVMLTLKIPESYDIYPISGKIIFFNRLGFGVSFPETEQIHDLRDFIQKLILPYTNTNSLTI